MPRKRLLIQEERIEHAIQLVRGQRSFSILTWQRSMGSQSSDSTSKSAGISKGFPAILRFSFPGRSLQT